MSPGFRGRGEMGISSPTPTYPVHLTRAGKKNETWSTPGLWLPSGGVFGGLSGSSEQGALVYPMPGYPVTIEFC